MWNRLPRWFGRSKNAVVSKVSGFSAPASPPQLEALLGEAGSNFDILLTKLRSHWLSGDWDMLSKISADELKTHPERAKLALLVATANEQLGQPDIARNFLQLAKEWGANNREIAQLLVSSVHGTLGRARLLSGSEEEAERHFTQSLPAKNLPEKDQISQSIRMRHEAKLLNITEKTSKAPLDEKRSSDSKPSRRDHMKTPDELASDIKKFIKFEIGNAVRQIEAYLGIQSYLTDRQLPLTLHGWPISPDFGYYLLQTVDTQNYDLIIEFGSGTSTTLIATALDTIRKRAANPSQLPIQIAFEHLSKYLEQTSSLLEERGLSSSVVTLAPLIAHHYKNVNSPFQFYDCIEILRKVKLQQNSENIFVIVDGPPASSGIKARYPALPVIMETFPNARISLLLDDYNREHEKEIFEDWKKELKNKNREFRTEIFSFEKGAALICVEKPSK